MVPALTNQIECTYEFKLSEEKLLHLQNRLSECLYMLHEFISALIVLFLFIHENKLS